MANFQPLINGQEYSFVQATLVWKGQSILFTEISYMEEQNKVNNYTNGKYTSSRTYGKIEPTANSITLPMTEVQKLEAIAPERGSLHSIPPSDLVIIYARTGQPSKTDIIKNFEFKGNGTEGSVDDDYLTSTYATIFSHIDK